VLAAAMATNSGEAFIFAVAWFLTSNEWWL
jgi:hypothetical protein